MDSVDTIEKDGKILAIIVRAGFDKPGTVPISPEDMPLQLVMMERKRDDSVSPHIHPSNSALKVAYGYRHEVLHVVKGAVEIGVFDHKGEEAETVTLGKGDTILLTAGHSTRFLEDTRIVEVKGGPYPGLDRDKIWLR